MVDNSKQIHIIGSNGFIGRSIKKYSKNKNIIYWSHSSKKNFLDIHNEETWTKLLNQKPAKVLLLSWPGLPNYNSKFHLEINLPQLIKLIEKLSLNNLKKIVVTGTCYEYGLLEGQLSEDINPNPVNQYAIAKNFLRMHLQKLCEDLKLNWIWTRLFYTYGPNQNENSLIPSLLKAIENNEKTFNISSGKQSRDFIHVREVVNLLLFVINNQLDNGIYNIGSGKPMSILEKVQEIKEEQKSDIEIITNYYKDREDEPLSFWANMQKLNKELYASK